MRAFDVALRKKGNHMQTPEVLATPAIALPCSRVLEKVMQDHWGRDHPSVRAEEHPSFPSSRFSAGRPVRHLSGGRVAPGPCLQLDCQTDRPL